MAQLDAQTPQVNDPELEADLTRLLTIVGQLGRLNVADIVLPTVSLGSVVTQTVRVEQPAFRSSDVFTEQIQIAAPANTVHADTGQLAAGAYDIDLYISGNTNDALAWLIQHRDAANAANVVLWQAIAMVAETPVLRQTFAYEFALNERLRILNASVITAGISTLAWIFARRRT